MLQRAVQTFLRLPTVYLGTAPGCYRAGVLASFDVPLGSKARQYSQEGQRQAETEKEEPSTSSGGKVEEAAATPSDADEMPEVEALQTLLLERTEELEDTRKQLAAAKDRTLRAVADMENFRARANQQLEESKQFAVQSFAKSVLDVADNLERALASVPLTVLHGSQTDDSNVEPEAILHTLRSFHDGVGLSQKVMIKIFRDNGLEPIESTVGDDFDPNLHNAMFEIPTSDYEPGKIASVIKTGYTLHGRVIRAADVGVARAADT
eukprot:TRINITY_DN8426_c0_g1_i6.p1 TRINITY_DN8426_c0_g1~~TRINITY_DN8426_c0_g1_i6.p1  ORF type:complete len:265 (+),score=38.78 TRINITY_DN8426_c0_g1_i6:124-918(+)